MHTMAARAILFIALCAGAADAGKVGSFMQQRRAAAGQVDSERGLVHLLDFKHKLRVCNAYPYSGAMDVYSGEKSELKLTEGNPMPYKSCRDMEAPLKSGDKLNFKVGDATAGSFSVSDLPESDAVLLLVIHRHDTVSTAVSFESHVFGNIANAQVAVIDAYKGSGRSKPKIRDGKASKNKRNEDLQFDSVLAVNQGVYEVVLDNLKGAEISKNKLVALNHQCYVVLRTGVEAQQGESYPEELVVFPQSDPSELPHSGSAHLSANIFVLVAMAAIAVGAMA